ncbi:hypothetical protein EDB86DRAFT_393015 [Lactarius hatsudake]|nr:hypothetical protein EDB86DRAFT_393015 [Lactarius hatsudake]
MVGDAITYDPFTFRKHFKNVGRAYREQATTLVEICRLYVETYPQTYTENDELQNIFRLADAALSAAGRAKKGTTTEATEAFARLQEEIKRFGPLSRKVGKRAQLNHDVLLDIFRWYRLGNTTEGVDRGWKLERWWFKLIHVCQTWRYLILASPTSLDLHLVCTYGTPVTTVLTHLPPLPLIIYYPGGLADAAGKNEKDVLFLLQQRERVGRIHIGAPAESLLHSLDGEYPSLRYLVIRSRTSSSSRTSVTVELRAKLQAPLLRHLTLSDVRLPVGSELLLRAEGLVVLELLDVTDSFEAHPAHLVAQLARMSQLERLVVHFRTALPNRKVEQTLSSARMTRAALPRLKFISFHGGSAYLEGILSRINAPGLRTLSLNFFAQLTFDLPCLVRSVRAAQEFSLSSTAYAEGDSASFQFESAKLDFGAASACLLLYSRETDPGQAGTIANPVQLRLGCRTLDWQLAAFAQICGVLVPLLERVERLTLVLHISHPSSDADSSPDMDVDSDRGQWHTLLRAFGSTKTLELAGPQAQYLRRSLLPLPAELLPALQKPLGGNEELHASNAELPAGNGVQEEIKRFGPLPRKGVRDGRGKKLFDPSTALASASKKDKESMSAFSKLKSVLFKANTPSSSTKQVNFIILESLHEKNEHRLIINQEIDIFTTTAEIVWRFSRYPERSADRITPNIASKQNPHFYVQLSNDPTSFDSEFHKDPLKDFSDLRHGEIIYVLLNKSCRLFLDAAEPHVPRIFGNLWKPHKTVILKDVDGTLESEDTILRNMGKNQDYWYRPSIMMTDLSQHLTQSEYSGDDCELIKRPVGNGRDLMELALRSQKVDFMIRDRSRPLPSADSGWKPLPSPMPSARVQAPENRATPRQSATRLPQLEYSNPNASASSIGGDTVFTTVDS